MSNTNGQTFIACLVEPAQDVEDMFQQMFAMRRVDDSIGVHLTALGKLVGQPRDGVTDDGIYRRLVRAKISVNKSSGTIDELLVIAELVVWDDDAEYVIDNTGVAALILRVEDIALDYTVAVRLIQLLRKAVKGGVRIVLEWWPSADPDELFTFDGESDGTAFPDTNGVGGGMLIDAME